MHRRVTTVALATTLAAVLAVSACSSKSTDSGSESSGSAGSGLTISPVAQINTAGEEQPAVQEANALNPAEPGGQTCAPATIAMAGALTGADAALGINIKYGAQLAVDQHNKANPNCQITLKTFDTEGDPQKATQVAPQITNDDSIIGLIGPAFSGETKATGGIFNQAGLVSVTASATNPGLTGNGWKTFFRGLANDDVQGPAVANYLTGKLGKQKVCVIKDDTDYGAGLENAVTEALGAKADASCSGDVKKGERDFSAVISKVTAAQPDAVFYAGYYAEAAPLAQQLKTAAPNVTFVSGDGANDPQFTAQAGDSAKGAYLSCPCGPAPSQFAQEYQSAFNQAPGVYSVEAYDIAAIMMKGIEEGNTTRPKLLQYIGQYKGAGLARQYSWQTNGELSTSLIWVYEVK
ncbi:MULTISPECIES: branched-chain amino acid ABC transporter substrate-binding protein [unclassified Gordonia (in: high G+C Gram-positive bacteria)]|uniref:branched-chain amino acid ABC transporter substrate-binding protein n=1 Tax=unclassified Gordonia (in: high G+C Gram-positive bacteria) TaxID=2657482 RepID=UPI001F1058DD|nr:branched-chain amino acid ABC transporter substrate-binding protein [Gordonia sp. ABSL49_1]MCH5641423.1 branched-chain amino acid ABC transporter substrate-binding protein [Gordonia sp. ABSL49_1]